MRSKGNKSGGPAHLVMNPIPLRPGFENHTMMKTVKFHRYAQHSGTEVYNDPLGKCISVLPANSWIGITHASDGWYHVITAQVDGWVRIEDTTTGKHARLSPRPPVNADGLVSYTLVA